MPRTALLVMDYQVGIVEKFIKSNEDLKPVQELLKFARSNNEILIIFVCFQVRYGQPERTQTDIDALSSFDWSEEKLKIDQSLNYNKNEAVVLKPRSGAFYGSDLDVILRAQKIEEIVLAGISTSGSVLGTTKDALDRDYKVTIVSDACLDMDQEVHQVLISKVLLKFGTVMTHQEWISRMTK